MRTQLPYLKFNTLLKVLVSSLLLMLFSVSLFGQTTVQIPTSTGPITDYNYGPIYRSDPLSPYNYSRYAYIYTTGDLCPAGIDSGAVISQVGWNKTTIDSL